MLKLNREFSKLKDSSCRCCSNNLLVHPGASAKSKALRRRIIRRVSKQRLYKDNDAG